MKILERGGQISVSLDRNKYFRFLGDVRFRHGRLCGRYENLHPSVAAAYRARLKLIDLEALFFLERAIQNDVGIDSLSEDKKPEFQFSSQNLNRGRAENFERDLSDLLQNRQQSLDVNLLMETYKKLFPNQQSIAPGSIWRTHELGINQHLPDYRRNEPNPLKIPACSEIVPSLKNFINWYNASMGFDTIEKSAISEYWIYILEPFSSRNIFMRRMIASFEPILKDKYFGLISINEQFALDFREYRDKLEDTIVSYDDVTLWIVYFLKHLDKAILKAEQRLQVLEEISKIEFVLSSDLLNQRQKLMIQKLKSEQTKLFSSSDWARLSGCSQDTAAADIKNLLEHNIAKKGVGGGRNTRFVLNSLIFSAIDAI